jgi:hypothetical protein
MGALEIGIGEGFGGCKRFSHSPQISVFLGEQISVFLGEQIVAQLKG